MTGFLTLLVFLLLGSLLKDSLQLPIPASIAGMLLLLVFLLLRRSVPAPLETTTRFLAPWLPMFLVPVSVGIIAHQTLLEQQGLRLLVILTVSLVPGILVCGWIMSAGRKDKS